MKTAELIPLYRAFPPSPSGAFHVIPDSEFYTTEYNTGTSRKLELDLHSIAASLLPVLRGGEMGEYANCPYAMSTDRQTDRQRRKVCSVH